MIGDEGKTPDNYSPTCVFGIARDSVCCIVHEVCEAGVEVMMQKYIKWPEGEHLTEVVEFLAHKWGYPSAKNPLVNYK